MKNSKLFLAVGSLVLACGAIMAAKPVKKFTTLAAHFPGIGNNAGNASINVTVGHFTTIQGSNHTAILVTASGNTKIATLLTGSGGTAKLYYK